MNANFFLIFCLIVCFNLVSRFPFAPSRRLSGLRAMMLNMLLYRRTTTVDVRQMTLKGIEKSGFGTSRRISGVRTMLMNITFACACV